KSCITLREETEWTELVEIGANMLVGAKKEQIVQAVRNKFSFKNKSGIYGDGNSSKKIIGMLVKD
ncbi:MAG: UDP-N-acetyl glucosamine 2-epimerase, partial [Candidatus Methanofastidiosa archaeon]|nr:UDP-N-acetyl glucosamine 2-epimerase [Candidatus Methanofastidiosa archaeon]